MPEGEVIAPIFRPVVADIEAHAEVGDHPADGDGEGGDGGVGRAGPGGVEEAAFLVSPSLEW